MTSETANWPPGRSAREASRITVGWSAVRLMTQLEMTTSTHASGSGMSSTPASAALRRASSSKSSVMSRPITLPAGPTRLAEMRTSAPPPQPRSSTVSSSRSSATAVGTPQPSDAATAASGAPSVSAPSYSAPPNPPVASARLHVARPPPQQTSAVRSAAAWPRLRNARGRFHGYRSTQPCGQLLQARRGSCSSRPTRLGARNRRCRLRGAP